MSDPHLLGSNLPQVLPRTEHEKRYKAARCVASKAHDAEDLTLLLDILGLLKEDT